MNDSIHVQSRAVIIQDKHILLCKTTGLNLDFYFLPGGHIEHYESARKALLRELIEEIGEEFSINRFLGCLEYSFDPGVTIHAKCHTHEYSFIFEATCLTISPAIPLRQLEEHIEVLWLNLNELGHIDLRPKPLKKLIPRWLEMDMNNAFESEMIKTSMR